VGVQMVGEGPWHEFNLWLSKWARNVLIIPAHINRNVAHREAGWEGSGIIIHHGIKPKAPANLGRVADPIVANLVSRLSRVSQIKIGAAPKAFGFALQSLIDQSAGDLGGRAIDSSYQHQSLSRAEHRPVSRAEQRIANWAVQRNRFVDEGQQRQFAVDRGLI